MWLLAATACSPYSKYQTTGKLYGCESCYFDFNSEKETRQDWREIVAKGQMAMAITHFLLGFLVPLTAISICADCIQAKTWRESWLQPKRLLVVVVRAFFIFWFPFNGALGEVGATDISVVQRCSSSHGLPSLWAASTAASTPSSMSSLAEISSRKVSSSNWMSAFIVCELKH